MDVFMPPSDECPICAHRYDAAFVRRIFDAKPLTSITSNDFAAWLISAITAKR